MKFVLEIDLEAHGMNSLQGVHGLALNMINAIRGLGPPHLDIRERFEETDRLNAPRIVIMQAGLDPDMQTDLNAKMYVANEDFDRTPIDADEQWSPEVARGENIHEVAVSSYTPK